MSGEESGNVYVVTQGRYSDYGIEAVCSTRDRAERVVARFREENLGDCRIEPWPLDGMLDHEFGPVFRAAIRLDDGSALRRQDGSWVHGPDQDGGRSFRHPRRANVERASENDFWPFSIKVESPISFDHALKLATEERQAWLRERPGIDDDD